MSKNLITKPEVRKALVASGNLKPVTGADTIAAIRVTDKAASQAAAIAARRKELGIKPVVHNKCTDAMIVAKADTLIKQSLDPMNASLAAS